MLVNLSKRQYKLFTKTQCDGVLLNAKCIGFAHKIDDKIVSDIVEPNVNAMAIIESEIVLPSMKNWSVDTYILTDCTKWMFIFKHEFIHLFEYQKQVISTIMNSPEMVFNQEIFKRLSNMNQTDKKIIKDAINKFINEHHPTV